MISDHLYTYLAAQAGITSICSTRIYPLILPQKPTYPAITYSEDDSNYTESFTGQTDHVQSIYQIDSWATTYAGATSLGNAVSAALKNTSGSFGGITIQRCTVLSGPVSVYEDSVEAYRQTYIFSIWHNEG